MRVTAMGPKENVPSISIVIPVYNSEFTIRKCLDSIMRLRYPREKLEVILVDDGSTDKTLDVVEEYPVRLIQKEHGGYPSAMNAGIKVAKGEIIAIVDSDIYVNEYCLKKIVEEFEGSKVGIVSGYVATAPTLSFWAKVAGFAAEDCYDTIGSKYLDFLTSTCTAYRRQLFAEVGLFDEELWRGSDLDLAHRAFKAGWKIILQRNALCYHDWDRSLKSYFRKQALQIVYQVRLARRYPELVLGKKQHPPSLYIPTFLTGLVLLAPLWFLLNFVWVSPVAFIGLILYHMPQTVRIIRKHNDWSMLLFPVALSVRYFAWLTGLAIGLFSFIKGR